MNRTALIFGVTGQDGSYLSELLLEKDYNVIGVKRRSSTDNTYRLATVKYNDNFTLIEGDITDPSSVNQIMGKYKPDECYNLAAMSHVGTSFDQPCASLEINTLGVLYILEAIRVISPKTKFLQAGTSEEFGSNYIKKPYWESGHTDNPLINPPDGYLKVQDESTPLTPNSPYAVSKVAAHHLVKIYRGAYNLHASVSISMNHGSPRRGENFVTRKITKWLGEFLCWQDQEFLTIGRLYVPEDCICYGRPRFGPELFPKLRLGNIDAKRDWGHAKDVVRGMWLMMQQESADDYILSTGSTHSVRQFLDKAFDIAGLNSVKDFDRYIIIDPDLYRPIEVPYLLGDNSKAKKELNWQPEITFDELVTEMVRSDLNYAKEKTQKNQKTPKV